MTKRARDDSEDVEISGVRIIDLDDQTSEAPTPSASTESDHPVKYTRVDEAKTEADMVIRCSLPPHKNPVKLNTYAEYDTHYRQFHSNRCPECFKNLPSDHYLNLHIADNHDPLNEVLRERGTATYACFAEECDYKFKDQRKRRMHAIDKHGFPKFYDFFLVNTGIDKRNSMIRPDPHKPRNRKNSKATTHSEDSTSMEVDLGEGISDKGGSMEELTSLTSKLSGLNFVPRGVRFGQSQRGGFKR
ncbi:hypothetical protein EG327_010720 [Venturia inaequalis]|uniref:C2H2-type domain-containing protein n=1 Tax=Venturia inaequalis TaxID=5025 RepID=A0A8H3YU26_VENIN|nr:hypothetical protein EG327_010720 [Venturia inaequalis]